MAWNIPDTYMALSCICQLFLAVTVFLHGDFVDLPGCLYPLCSWTRACHLLVLVGSMSQVAAVQP